MAKYEIRQERDKCIGCGACASVCAENWIMKPDGKSTPKDKSIDDLGCNMQAAKGCPVNVIHIIETETGKKLV